MTEEKTKRKRLNKDQKERFEEIRLNVPTCEDVAAALKQLEEDSDNLEKFMANVADALSVVSDLEGSLQDLEAEAEQLQGELEED